MKKILLIVLFSLNISTILNAQTKIQGKVFDEYLEPLAGVSIKTTTNKTISNIDGSFNLNVSEALPLALEVFIVGYQTEIIKVTNDNKNEVNVILKESSGLDEVIVSASRTPERILESPVTIERLGVNSIKKGTSVNFFDGLENLKGVDINVNSLSYKSVNTRGFAAFENVRFVELIDGMDMALPSLNFSMGNNTGATEIDVETLEILPGAASALYGANAFNGILLIKTKSPFEYDGVTAKYRMGVTSQKSSGNNPFYDVSARVAHKFSKFFAAKAVFSVYTGEEWHANDNRNSNGVGGVIKDGNRYTDVNYDGVNIYGDEISANLRTIASLNGKIDKRLLPLIPDVNVSRTGYQEKYLLDNKAKSYKFSASLNYRPWGDDDLEIIVNSRLGRGNNMYQGQNRYFQKNYSTQQHKLEFLGKNFFLRGYYYQASAGDSYNTRFAGFNINNSWKPNKVWYGDYIQEYLKTKSHEKAREFADVGRFLPGTKEFNNAFNQVTKDANSLTGAKFEDESSLTHIDGNYNFKDVIDWAEIQVGVSYRSFLLKTNGKIFTDSKAPITFNEFGVYSQLQKKMLEDRLKFTGTVRYDKSKNFDSSFSPRVSLSYSFGEEKRRNLRFSYQTAFREPTSQEQYIGLFTGFSHILGSAPDNLDRYVVTVQNRANTPTILTGNSPYTNGVTAESFNEFRTSSDPTKLKKANYSLVKPEEISSYELGYRAMFNLENSILELDVNGYYSFYDDLVTLRNVIVPNYGGLLKGSSMPDATAFKAIKSGDFSTFNIRTNSSADISSYGLGIGVKTNVFEDFDFGISYNWSDFNFNKESDPNFKPGFNLAKHKVKVQFGNENLFENFGFNINARWQDAFLWESNFLDGMVNARTVVDAQVNYKVPSIKSRFKIGGTNIGGAEYFTAPGTGAIGSIYYVSWTFND